MSTSYLRKQCYLDLSILCSHLYENMRYFDICTKTWDTLNSNNFLISEFWAILSLLKCYYDLVYSFNTKFVGRNGIIIIYWSKRKFIFFFNLRRPHSNLIYSKVRQKLTFEPTVHETRGLYKSFKPLTSKIHQFYNEK